MAEYTKNLWGRWNKATLLVRLVVINCAVLLVGRIGGLILSWSLGTSDFILFEWLVLPGNLESFLTRPWTLLTYMFTQEDIIHLLLNMLWLYGFGTIFLLFDSSRHLLGLYLLGGIVGGCFFFFTALGGVFPPGAVLLGSSGAVVAIVVGVAVLNPDFPIRLFLLGMVKLKWIAIVSVILFAMGLTGNNAGGHLAHLGGALTGLVYGLKMRRGTDITRPVNMILDKLANAIDYNKFKLNKRRSSKRNDKKKDDKRMEEILAKLRSSGYNSLTPEEKALLFRRSR